MNSDATRPIGVFDSGAGGLSVLQAIRAALPAENLIYIADTAYTPYGNKSRDFIQQRCLELGQLLFAQGCKAIVVACNTATASGIDHMRPALQIPVLGMEPGIKPAVAASKNKVIGIMATQGTLHSLRYAKLERRTRAESTIYTQPCNGLVELIEDGRLYDQQTLGLLQNYIHPLLEQGVDTLVLGCTHYPLLAGQIREIVGPDVIVIDTGQPLARHLKNVLQSQDMQREDIRSGSLHIFSTGQKHKLQNILDILDLDCCSVHDLQL